MLEIGCDTSLIVASEVVYPMREYRASAATDAAAL
jgi:hypothetical protein